MKTSQDDLRSFAGEKSDYYLPHWIEIEGKKKYFSFNFTTFITSVIGIIFLITFQFLKSHQSIVNLIGNIFIIKDVDLLLSLYLFPLFLITNFFWYIYRKMYIFSLIINTILIISFIILFLILKNYFNTSITFETFHTLYGYHLITLFLIFALINSLISNYLYYRYATHKITSIKSSYGDQKIQKDHVNHAGSNILSWIPHNVRDTLIPILIALFAFTFSIVLMDFEAIKNIEYFFTDKAKFKNKTAYKTKITENLSHVVNSNIMIMGITERSQSYYLNKLFGSFPWPRKVYSNFLNYFYLQDADPKVNTDEIRKLNWNSIVPNMVLFDLIFDFESETKLDFKKDFKGLYITLQQENKTIDQWGLEKRWESDDIFSETLEKFKDHKFILSDTKLERNKDARFDDETSKIRYQFLKKWEIKNVRDKNGKQININESEPIFYDIKAPLPHFLKNLYASGSPNIESDSDGKKRKMPIIYKVFDERFMINPVYFPNITLIMAMKFYEATPEQISVKLGDSVTIHNATIRKPIQYISRSKESKPLRRIEYIDESMDYLIRKLVTLSKNNSLFTTLNLDDFVKSMSKDENFKKILHNKYKKRFLLDFPRIIFSGHFTKYYNAIKNKNDKLLIKKAYRVDLPATFEQRQFNENILKNINSQKDKKYLLDHYQYFENEKLYSIRRNKINSNETRVRISNILDSTGYIYYKSFRLIEKYDNDTKIKEKIINIFESTHLFNTYKSILIKEFPDHNFNESLPEKIIIKDIKDFLYSMAETAYYNQSNFFQLEEKSYFKLTPDKEKHLINFISKRQNEYDILNHLLKEKIIKKDFTEEKKILFINDISAKISYNNISYPKDDLVSEIVKASKSNTDKVNNTFQLLIKNKLIEDYIEKDENVIYNYKLLIPDSEVDQLKNEREKNFIQYLNFYLQDDPSPKTDDFYKEFQDKYKVDKNEIQNIIDSLVNNKIIDFSTKKIKFIYYSMPNIENIELFSKTKIKDLTQRNIVSKILFYSKYIIENLKKGGIYYTLNKKDVIDYLTDKLSSNKNLNENKIDKILTNLNAKNLKNKIINIKIKKNYLIIEGADGSGPEGLIEYRDKIIHNQILTAKQFVNSSRSAKDILPVNETLLNISKLTKISPQIVKFNLEDIQHSYNTELANKNKVEKDANPSQTTENKTNKDTFFNIKPISYKNQKITFNPKNIKNYIVSKQNINIPIDEQGQMIVNFQPYDFEKEDFGKYMRFSRGTKHPIHKGDIINFDWNKFKNKIILVGFYTTSGLGSSRDYFETPYGLMYGVQIIANALYTIIERDFIEPLPANVINNSLFSISSEYILMLLFALILGIVIPRISIINGFIFFLSIGLSYFILNVVVLFPIYKMDIPLLGSNITAFTTFITLIVFKLMTEEKDKKKIKSTFSKYVSPDVVNNILSSNKSVELGGEDRTLTVLFSDIRGFTTLSEGLTPQDLVQHLNEYLSAMTEIVLKYQGTLDKYIGDALMAFWGAPIYNPEHALFACKASIEMIERLEKLNTEWPKEKHISIGIGLNTGIMTVGNMGSSQRMDYTIMGDSVNLGSRVEGVNKMYKTEIIITEFTYDLVKDKIFARELDLIRVKGKNEPVKIFELLGIKE